MIFLGLKSFVLICLFVSIPAAPDESLISYPDGPSNRFFGGVDTKPYEFPWMARVITRFNSCLGFGLVCAGTLISDQWVLTASSCFNTKCNNESVSYVELTLGLYDLSVNSTMEPWRQVFNSTEFYYTTNSLPALVKLPQPVSLSAYINPTSLPLLCDPNRLGDKVTVTGWGNVTEGEVPPTPLQKFDDTLVASRKCNGTELPLEPSSGYIWISGTDGKNADSGCPVNYVRPEDGNWAVIGIFSGTYPNWPECSEIDHPYPYIRVQSSLEWIYNTTGLPNPDPPGTICDNTTSNAWHVTNSMFCSLMSMSLIFLCSSFLFLF